MATALQQRVPILPRPSPGERVAAPAARKTADYRLDELALDPETKGIRAPNIGPLLTDGTLHLTMTGASTVDLTIIDRDDTLLRSSLLTEWTWGQNADHRDDSAWIKRGRKIDITVGDVGFRLVRLEQPDQGMLTLSFEDLVVAKMREWKGARVVAARQSDTVEGVTRAQFVGMLCRDARVPFYIPELLDPQPTAPADTGLTRSERKQRGQKGLDRSRHITVKGAKAKPDQLRNLEIALDEADRQRAPELAVVAMLCAGTAESGFKSIPNAGGSNYTGVFQGSKDIFKASDTEKEAHWFLKGGKGFNHGGGIYLARQNPSMSPGEIATLVESGGQPASFYGRWEAEARRTLAAYRPGISSEGSTTVTYEKAFTFSRGEEEDSWDATQRLAEEVNWRAFIRQHPDGRGRAVWYVSDEFLAAQAPAFVARENRTGQDGTVLAIRPTIDLGARNLVADLSITAHAGRWTALPGMRTMVEGKGPADGGWLVQDVERPLWVNEIQVTGTKPLGKKPEPAPETEQVTFGTEKFGVVAPGALGKAQRFYDACAGISRAGGPYKWAGGHGALASTNPKAGLDCSGAVSLALFRAGLFEGRTTGISSGLFAGWGEPGTGRYFTVWYHSGHVFVELSIPGRPGKRFDTSPQGAESELGPRIRSHHRSHAGFSPRHFKGL